MGLFAVGTAIGGYLLVKWSWRLNVVIKRLKRKQNF